MAPPAPANRVVGTFDGATILLTVKGAGCTQPTTKSLTLDKVGPKFADKFYQK